MKNSIVSNSKPEAVNLELHFVMNIYHVRQSISYLVGGELL
jgi:hypothetical protein